MDAVYSGQAGVLALIEGANVRIRRADDFDCEMAVAREEFGYLFDGCTDVVAVKAAREDSLKRPFLEAWEADRGLRLFLISLDPEEDDEVRSDAATLLEGLLSKTSTRIFIENELYSQVLPAEADHEFLGRSEQWKSVTQLISEILVNQNSIQVQRAKWDSLPLSLFDNERKYAFEEEAIRRGAFRKLASVDFASGNRNLAIFDCYRLLADVPNSREVINHWISDFKVPIIRKEILIEDAEEVDDEGVSSYQEFLHSQAQQSAIIEKLKEGSLHLARKFSDQLVRHQLTHGGPEYAAKSLCSLAQEAKSLHLHSLQLEWAQRAVDTNPTDGWTHGQAADALIQFARLNEALHELDLCEKFGDAQFAATTRARILRHQGKLDEALIAFRKAREAFPGHEDESYTWSGAAETLRDMWKFEDALAEYEAGLAKFPDVLFLRCGRAAVLADLGQLDEAIAAYSVAQLRDDLFALNGKASVLKELGRFRDAQNVIAKAIELFPADPVARCIQAEILRLQQEFQGALQLYEYIRLNHSTIPAAYSGYAEVLRDMRRIPEAIIAYKDAVERFPDDVRLANGYANILKISDNLPEALRLYEANVQQFPYDLYSKSGRADLLKRLGRYEDAIAAYDEILRTWPSYESARNGKAAILVVKDRFDEALSLLPTQAPSTRNDWIAWHIRGMVLLRKNEIESAIKFFTEASLKIPFAREKRYFDGALSTAKLRQGKFEEAAEAVVESVGGLSNVLRMHAYGGMGKSESARSIYGELRARCPSQLVELRDAVAGRFGIAGIKPAHNDNWIFARESEALLQEAA